MKIRHAGKPLTRARIALLKRRAAIEPASEAALLWTMVWGFVSIGLFWFLSEQTFPQYDGEQGVSLGWVGALLTAGAILAAGLCYLLYRYRLRCKRRAIAELEKIVAAYQSTSNRPDSTAIDSNTLAGYAMPSTCHRSE